MLTKVLNQVTTTLVGQMQQNKKTTGEGGVKGLNDMANTNVPEVRNTPTKAPGSTSRPLPPRPSK